MITCYECGTAQGGAVEDDCVNCGERIGVACRDCVVLFAINDLDKDQRCEQCAEDHEHIVEHQRRYDEREGRGDYLRDQQKDGAW